MSGDMLGAAIVFGALGGLVVSILGATGMYEKDGPLANLFRDIRDGLVAGWCLIRNTLWSLTHRSPVRPKRKPYLSSDTVEELEIECYIGPYAEPFRAESLKAREAAKRKRDSVRVIEPCERGDETAHMLAMNGRCVLCGTFPPRTPEYAPVKLDGDTLADCLGDPSRDHHWWRTFRDLEGFHTKCLNCGVRQERTQIFG